MKHWHIWLPVSLLIISGCTLWGNEPAPSTQGRLVEQGKIIYKDPIYYESGKYYDLKPSDLQPLPASRITKPNPSLMEAKTILRELTSTYLYMYPEVQIIDLDNDNQPEVIGFFENIANFDEDGAMRIYVAKYKNKKWVLEQGYLFVDIFCKNRRFFKGKLTANKHAIFLACENNKHEKWTYYIVTMKNGKPVFLAEDVPSPSWAVNAPQAKDEPYSDLLGSHVPLFPKDINQDGIMEIPGLHFPMEYKSGIPIMGKTDQSPQVAWYQVQPNNTFTLVKTTLYDVSKEVSKLKQPSHLFDRFLPENHVINTPAYQKVLSELAKLKQEPVRLATFQKGLEVGSHILIEEALKEMSPHFRGLQAGQDLLIIRSGKTYVLMRFGNYAFAIDRNGDTQSLSALNNIDVLKPLTPQNPFPYTDDPGYNALLDSPELFYAHLEKFINTFSQRKLEASGKGNYEIVQDLIAWDSPAEKEVKMAISNTRGKKEAPMKLLKAKIDRHSHVILNKSQHSIRVSEEYQLAQPGNTTKIKLTNNYILSMDAFGFKVIQLGRVW
ncbi:hypothetical protein ACFQ4J_15075 [Laceyella tengchongensis]|jgi:hypothetical protein